MMSHDRPMDPGTMGYGMGGAPMTQSAMGMNPTMSGGGPGYSTGGPPMQPLSGPVIPQQMNPHSQTPPMPGYGPIPPPPRAHRMPAHLSAVQMKLLTYQMKAYRCLAQSKPIPEPIRNLIMSHATGISNRSMATPPPSSIQQQSSSTAMGADSSTPSTVVASKSPATTSSQLTKQTSATDSTGTSVTMGGEKPKEIIKVPEPPSGSGTVKPGAGQLKQMKLAPVAKPKGLDPDVIVKERETRYG